MIYLDTSAVVSLLVPDAHSILVRSFFEEQTPATTVSILCRVEFASGVSIKLRQGKLTEPFARRAVDLFDSWRARRAEAVDLVRADYELAGAFVRRFELALRAPDALHLAVCSRLDLPILTFDGRQAKAARELGLGLVDPGR